MVGEDTEKVIFWQEQVIKIEKLIKYAPLYSSLKKAQAKLEKLKLEQETASSDANEAKRASIPGMSGCSESESDVGMSSNGEQLFYEA